MKNTPTVTLGLIAVSRDCFPIELSKKRRKMVAEGEILNIEPKSFGCIAVFAIREMGRFYRHVLIEKRFPHHTGVAFMHAGKVMHDAMKLIGVDDVSFNLPKGMLYPGEHIFN